MGQERPGSVEIDNITSGDSVDYDINLEQWCCWNTAWSVVQSSLFDNTYISAERADLPLLEDSVFLNGHQQWINYNGEQVTKGNVLTINASANIFANCFRGSSL